MDPRADRRPAEPETVVRFGRAPRIEHALVILLFAVLMLTGLPQKWPATEMSRSVLDALGGIFAARFVHRLAGVAFSLLLVVHLTRTIGGVLSSRMRPAMLFVRRDFHDAVANLRYHLGRAEAPPRFGRFDYRQKFEYWGLLFGSVVMVASGFLLYFPMVFTRWLPAELVPAAKVMHSNEALLALLIVVVWHLYAVILSPEVFPLDTSIFTGRISRRRLQEEHPLEYEERFGKE